ncbi:MAG: rRNA maturation RNase YbeY [Pusillimonas sp.]|nr:rRNA maturation RNase YbeY [Pusillimonas sp.]
MKKPASNHSPALSLSVQYAASAQTLPRWRLRRWIQAALALAPRNPDIPRVTLTLRLVNADEGRELNQQFRNRNYPTNVLTFEYGLEPEAGLMADIVLCLPVLYQEAQVQQKTIHAHAAHLTIHGVLHALGYDHQNDQDAQEMESLEARILQKLGFTNPYQVLPESH